VIDLSLCPAVLGVGLDMFGYAMGVEYAAAVVGEEAIEAGVGAVFQLQ
jgi:hypothetical protein